MCGICGEVRFDGTAVSHATVATMTEAMATRGPDGAGMWRDGWASLGHRRLSIIDLSDAAAQPMVDDELGIAVAFNGCIYNYRQLQEDLRNGGYRFRTQSDTEVVLAAYHRWGERFVDHLVGMFAIAIVDRRQRRLLLARDRLGIKPLYLASVRGGLRFASTLPALLSAGDVDTTIDPVALHHYLSWHSIVPAPRTLLRGVRKLPPATLRVIEADGRSREQRYWQPTYTRDPGVAGMDADEWQREIADALRTAVRRHIVADVPVGVLLSGGLDSSLIVAMLAEAGHDVRTFSIGFQNSRTQPGDEFGWSDQVAARYGTNHERISIHDESLVPAVQQSVAAMTEPMGTHDVVAFFLLSERVSRRVKVALAGQGADEIFAGYRFHQPFAAAGRADALDVFVQAFSDRDHDAVSRIVEPDVRCVSNVSRELVAAHLESPGADTALDAALRLDTHLLMPEDPVKRIDSMSMAWGLELRVPFLDQDLVALAAACPPELKSARGGKGALKQVARQFFPDSFVDRPKGYFPVPALHDLSGPVLDLVRDTLYSPAAKNRALLRREYIDELLAEPNRHRTPVGSNGLWQIAVLELWLQTRGIG
ncbi:N-acetylglutaminylglutamine amidotransferase [Actinoplanes sp. NPDC051633]|uniref:N-acetylglutaminylglutamine amidotransferase n=1 Tax=Actinoplanes sp. NPDC051633 TaxID=3155670 RepID=UPI003415B433